MCWVSFVRPSVHIQTDTRTLTETGASRNYVATDRAAPRRQATINLRERPRPVKSTGSIRSRERDIDRPTAGGVMAIDTSFDFRDRGVRQRTPTR